MHALETDQYKRSIVSNRNLGSAKIQNCLIFRYHQHRTCKHIIIDAQHLNIKISVIIMKETPYRIIGTQYIATRQINTISLPLPDRGQFVCNETSWKRNYLLEESQCPPLPPSYTPPHLYTQASWLLQDTSINRHKILDMFTFSKRW